MGRGLHVPLGLVLERPSRTRDMLKRHMEIHKAEKNVCPYEGCTKYFYAMHYLSNHIRCQHKNPYNVRMCYRVAIIPLGLEGACKSTRLIIAIQVGHVR